MSTASIDDLAEHVSHEDFRSGLPLGHFRVIVNPKLARAFVSQRLWLLQVILPLIGIGIALVLTGSRWGGGLMVFAGVALNRIVVWNAGRILLHLATRDRSVYAFATEHGIMEVRRA